MSTKTDYLTSPKGEIQFLALNRKVAKDMKPDSPEGYAVRLKFNVTTKEGAEWKKTINAINPNLIGTKHVNSKDEYTVRAFSKYLPEVVGNDGNALEELPNFYKNSTGTATMVVQPYTGNALGGAVTLAGIIIHDLDIGEQEVGGGENREAVLEQLRATIKNK